MSAPLAKSQLSPMTSSSLSYGSAPVQSRGLLHRVLNSLRWAADYPRRVAVMDELHRLSDRELTDIGLTRSEVRNVFSRTHNG